MLYVYDLSYLTNLQKPNIAAFVHGLVFRWLYHDELWGKMEANFDYHWEQQLI